MKKSLPGIVRIAYIECMNVPEHIELKALAGIPVGVYEQMTEICFTGNGTCTCESEYDNHAQVEKATLTFFSTDKLPIRRAIAFLALDTNGQWWLLGHRETPYPTIKRTQHSGTPGEERAVYTYEISMIGRKALIPVSV